MALLKIIYKNLSGLHNVHAHFYLYVYLCPLPFSRGHLLLHACLAGVGEFPYYQLCVAVEAVPFNHHKLLVLFYLGILVSISLVS